MTVRSPPSGKLKYFVSMGSEGSKMANSKMTSIYSLTVRTLKTDVYFIYKFIFVIFALFTSVVSFFTIFVSKFSVSFLLLSELH